MVLGGASIYGGSGTIAGTVLGVVIIATLRNGLNLAGVETTWQVLLLGACCGRLAVFLNEFSAAGRSEAEARQRRRDHRVLARHPRALEQPRAARIGLPLPAHQLAEG